MEPSPEPQNDQEQSTSKVLPSFTTEMFTALANYTTTPKSWHSNDHKEARNDVRDCISRLILSKKQTAHSNYENHLAVITELCEAHLYDRADSYAAYVIFYEILSNDVLIFKI